MLVFIHVIVLIFSITIRKVSQAFVSSLRGDDTAKIAGHTTLNPMVHLDWFGSVVLPTMLFFAKTPLVIGWAKCIPINHENFKNPKFDLLLVSLAAPASSVLLATFSGAGVRLMEAYPSLLSGLGESIGMFLSIMLFVNLFLFIVSLLPIPPLDGSAIVAYFLPKQIADRYLSLNQYVCLIILCVAVKLIPISKIVFSMINFLT